MLAKRAKGFHPPGAQAAHGGAWFACGGGAGPVASPPSVALGPSLSLRAVGGPIGATSAVGCFPDGASRYGVEDMSGNVWEWCATKWQDSYDDYRDDYDLEGDAPRVLRGGAFISIQGNVRCAFRIRLNPNSWDSRDGFRLVLAPGF